LHKRHFLRLRNSPLLGGTIFYQEVVSVWVRTEKLTAEECPQLL
jgi:hypothetical protein